MGLYRGGGLSRFWIGFRGRCYFYARCITDKRTLGKTQLQVTPLGFGTAELGILGIEQKQCDLLLNGVLDAGVNLIDTAECYKDAEEKVGKAIAARRSEFVLVTKCGHHVEDADPAEWTGKIIRHSAERSLKRLRTDCIDVLMLHSCTTAVLRKGEVVKALLECKKAGLCRFVGYSGDGADALAALGLDVFDCLETSINFCDQQVLDKALPAALTRNVGVIAKRALANSCWRDLSVEEPHYADYARSYTERLRKMAFTPRSLGFDGTRAELALRFTAFQPGLHVAITGSKTLQHVKDNIKTIERGPLPAAVVRGIRAAWAKHDDGTWMGQT
jgi:aryl-alcohol dehydrogenase-like predicted oxidoreductase